MKTTHPRNTWFLFHSQGNFIDLNVYLDYFFVKTLRFIDILHFPWHEMINFFFFLNRCFSFIKWKPLILETWFLSHSLGDFVELNVYLDHFFDKTLRFINIQYYLSEEMIDFLKNRCFSFIKWKPLILETWFLSHSLGDFVELNVYLDHFFDKTLRFINIQYYLSEEMIHFL